MLKCFVLCTLVLFMQNIGEVWGQSREALAADLEFKSGYNPYRIFGDVPVPIKKSLFRSRLFENCLCIYAGNVDAIYVRIKVASSLRYNLIKVFGYILHRKQIELNTDYYTSLYYILTVIKLNHVDIISLVDILNVIAFEKPSTQFAKLFEALEKHLPKYIACAATLWKEGIQNKTIDINKIVMPYNDDTLVVNILEGIIPEELKKVDKPDPPENPADEIEKKILFDFNLNILKLYQTLKKRTEVNLFPWVIAGLIHFFPRTLIQPDLEESILVLTQYFYERKINEFKDIVVTKDKREPFMLVRTYLEKIISSPKIISIIKDSALTIYRNLKNRSPTAVNPHYASFTYFVQPSEIKVQEMLKYISKGAFPLEIILAATRIRFYIDQKIIGFFSYTLTFNPYLYSSPNEVLIAILDRIMRRQPELPAEVLDSVGAVYSYLIFKNRYTAMPVRYPTDMIRMNVLIMGLKAPDISMHIRKSIDALVSLFIEEHIHYTDIIINKVPIYKCSTPLACFIELLLVLTKMNIFSNEKLKKIIDDFRNTRTYTFPIETASLPDQLCPTDILNDTKMEYYNELPQKENVTTPRIMTTSTTAIITTTQPPPTTPTEGPIKTVATAPPTPPTTPTAPKPTQTTDIVAPTALIEPAPANESAILILMRNVSNTLPTADADKEYIRKMLEVMEKAEFKLLMQQAHKEHATIIAAYLSILKLMKTEYSEEGFNKYLTKLLSKFAKIQNKLTNMIIEPQFEEPALYTLTIALPAPTDAEKAKFDLIKVVLSKQELFKLIHDRLKTNELTTVGALLKAVLREEAKLTGKLSKEELEAVQYYMTKVEQHGLADSKIKYTFQQTVVSKEVHITNIMDNALGFDKLSNPEKNQFNRIVGYLADKNILEQWTKWHLYSTSGEFTQAMFKYLLSTPSITVDVREALQQLTPLINLDKDGLKPSFLN